MEFNDEVIVELSKTKIALMLIGAAGFVGLGTWMFLADESTIRARRGFNDPMLVHGIGLIAIVFFGIIGLFALKKLFDRKPALVLNNAGLVDNVSPVSAGFIPWSEVEGAEIFEIQKQKLLVIRVKNPELYIARGNPLKQALNKANSKMVGSPISISSNALKTNFSELVSIFDEYHRKYAKAPAGEGSLEPLPEREIRSPEMIGNQVASDGNFINGDNGHEAQLLDWSPTAVRATLGSGGIGILVLLLSSLDMLLGVHIPFWAAFTASLLPAFVFFVAVPDFLPGKIVRPAQWFAVTWYVVFAALAISLSAVRGLKAVDLLLVGFVLLGLVPCLLAIRKLRVQP